MVKRNVDRQRIEADAKSKVARLVELSADHQCCERSRMVALTVSLFLNLMFMVAIFVILNQNS